MSAPTIVRLSPIQNTDVRASALGFTEIDELTDHRTLQEGQLHLLRGDKGKTTAACLAALNALREQDGEVIFATGNDAPEQVAKKLRAMARGFDYLDNDRVSRIQSTEDLSRIHIARTRTVAELVQLVGTVAQNKSPYLLIVDDLPLVDWVNTAHGGGSISKPVVSETREQQLTWFTRFLTAIAEGSDPAETVQSMGVISPVGSLPESYPMAVLVTASGSPDKGVPGGKMLTTWAQLVVDVSLTSNATRNIKNARLTKSAWGSLHWGFVVSEAVAKFKIDMDR